MSCERQIGAMKNGEGVSIIVKYLGLDLIFYLTSDQADDLILNIRKSMDEGTDSLTLQMVQGLPN